MGAPPGYFSRAGKVTKRAFKKTFGFLKNLSSFLFLGLRSPFGWFGLNRAGSRVWGEAADLVCPQGDPAAAQVPPLGAAEPDIGCAGRFPLSYCRLLRSTAQLIDVSVRGKELRAFGPDSTANQSLKEREKKE